MKINLFALLESSELKDLFLAAMGKENKFEYGLDIKAIPYGVEIIATSYVSDKMEWGQYRFPKSKKSRIRKKWRKNQKNYKLFFVAYIGVKIGNKILVSQKGHEYLSKNMQ